MVAVIGVALWMVQLSGGMIQTGMRNLDSWGFYITLFMFFVGLSAGGLIISSIPNAFGMKGFGDISRVAIWTSICCTCVAIGFVVVDLGGPLRLWELFVYSNLSSPLMWDIIVLSTYLILSIVYLWAYRRVDAGKMSHHRHPRHLHHCSGGGGGCAHGDGLDLLAVGGPRVLAHRPDGPRGSWPQRWIAARRSCSSWSSPCRRPGVLPSNAPPW